MTCVVHWSVPIEMRCEGRAVQSEHVRVWAAVREMADLRLTSREFVKRNSSLFGFDAEDILAGKRNAPTTWARYVMINMTAGAYPKLSTTQLGRCFNRKHSTVLYYLGRPGISPRYLMPKSPKMKDKK